MFSNIEHRVRAYAGASSSGCQIEIIAIAGVTPVVVNLQKDGMTVREVRGNLGGPYGDSAVYRFQPGEIDAVILRAY